MVLKDFCVLVHWANVASALEGLRSLLLGITLTLPLLRLLSSKAQGCKNHLNHGIHWIALAEYSEMNTHVPGFFSHFFYLFVSFCKSATSSIRVILKNIFPTLIVFCFLTIVKYEPYLFWGQLVCITAFRLIAHEIVANVM